MLDSGDPPSPSPSPPLTATADRRLADWRLNLATVVAPDPGCGHEGHGPECLCDVVVTDPVEILPMNHAQRSWCADRILKDLGFSPFKSWTPERTLAFFARQLEVHDQVHQELGATVDYWQPPPPASLATRPPATPPPPPATMPWKQYALWLMRTHGPYRYTMRELKEAMMRHYPDLPWRQTANDGRSGTLQRMRAAVLAAGGP